MKIELEAKFLDVDLPAMREKLRTVGASLVYPERLMKRNNFDFPDLRLEKVGGWVRLRDEGDKITLSYKQLNHRGFDGTKEAEVAVSNYLSAYHILSAIGLVAKAYQETKREKWIFGECEVTLDTWPWIPPTLEVEGKSEEEIKHVAATLGLDWGKALHGDIAIAYMHYFDVKEKDIYHHDNFSFDTSCPWKIK